jgi:hypothetical protein
MLQANLPISICYQASKCDYPCFQFSWSTHTVVNHALSTVGSGWQTISFSLKHAHYGPGDSGYSKKTIAENDRFRLRRLSAKLFNQASHVICSMFAVSLHKGALSSKTVLCFMLVCSAEA